MTLMIDNRGDADAKPDAADGSDDDDAGGDDDHYPLPPDDAVAAEVDGSEEPAVALQVEGSEEPAVGCQVEGSEEPIVAPEVEGSEEPIVAPEVEGTEELAVAPEVESSEEPTRDAYDMAELKASLHAAIMPPDGKESPDCDAAGEASNPLAAQASLHAAIMPPDGKESPDCDAAGEASNPLAAPSQDQDEPAALPDLGAKPGVENQEVVQAVEQSMPLPPASDAQPILSPMVTSKATPPTRAAKLARLQALQTLVLHVYACCAVYVTCMCWTLISTIV